MDRQARDAPRNASNWLCERKGMLDQGISDLLEDRQGSVLETKAAAPRGNPAAAPAARGLGQQRACVFCGSRVVLYPIADACTWARPGRLRAYTWDIRRRPVLGPGPARQASPPTCGRPDVVYGGAAKLEKGPARGSSPSTTEDRLRLQHLHRRPHRRRRGRRVPAGGGGLRIPVIPVDSKAQGHQEGRLQGRLRRHRPARRHLRRSRSPARAAAQRAGIKPINEFTWRRGPGCRDSLPRMGVPVVPSPARAGGHRAPGPYAVQRGAVLRSMLGLAALLEENGQPYRGFLLWPGDMAQACTTWPTCFADSDPGMAARAEALGPKRWPGCWRCWRRSARTWRAPGRPSMWRGLQGPLPDQALRHWACRPWWWAQTGNKRGLRAPAAAVRPGTIIWTIQPRWS